MLVPVTWSDVSPNEMIYTSSGAGPFTFVSMHTLRDGLVEFEHKGPIQVPGILVLNHGVLWLLAPYMARQMLKDFINGKQLTMNNYGSVLGPLIIDSTTINKDGATNLLRML